MTSLYSDTPYYQRIHDSRTVDLPFYQAIAGQIQRTLGIEPLGIQVLDLGAGTGRVAAALAADGHHIRCIEQEPAMLRALLERQSQVQTHGVGSLTIVEGSYLDPKVSFGEHIDLVMLPFNGLSHVFELDAVVELLMRIAKSIAPHGRFAFDVELPNFLLLAGSKSTSPTLRDPATGQVTRVTETTRFDEWRQVARYETEILNVETETKTTRVLELSQRGPQEIRALLRLAGLATLHETTNFRLDQPIEGEVYRGASAAWVCQAKPL